MKAVEWSRHGRRKIKKQKRQKLARVEQRATWIDIGETWKKVLSVIKNVEMGASLIVRVLYRMCRAARYWSVQIGAIERFYSVVLGAGKHVLAVVRGRHWTLTGLR